MKVTIDCGHGGEDSGARGKLNGYFESHGVLDIGLKLRALLESYVEVQMVREDDTFVSLPERARMANEWGADIFCSIHLTQPRQMPPAGRSFPLVHTNPETLPTR